MDETLNSNEEGTGDASENKADTSGDTEVSHGRNPKCYDHVLWAMCRYSS